MKYAIIFIVALLANRQGYSQQQASSAAYSWADVKKKTAGKICDTCRVNFAFSAEPHFSYVITGSGHTPNRFHNIKLSFKPLLSENLVQN